MSDDWDFDMEIVEDEKLDELSASGASSSEKTVHSEPGNPKKSDDSKSEAQNYDSATAQEGPIPSNFSNQEDGEAKQFGPFTLNVPEEWRAERQGEVKQLFTRGKQPTYAEDGVPVINQECIYWNDWHFENLRFLDQGEAKDWPEKYFPKKGDIILNSTGQGTLGRAQVYPDKERRAVDSHVTILRTTDELNPYFHRYFLESHLGQALLYSMCVNGSTGQIELSKTRLDLMPVPIPPLPEQRKIASVLYAVDQAIQKTEEIIEQAKRVKSGLVGDLMTKGIGHDRYKEVKVPMLPEKWTLPQDWELKPLKELTSKVTDGAHQTPTYVDEGVPFLKVKDIQSAEIDWTDTSRIPVKEHESLTKRSEPQRGDILLSKNGTIGITKIVDWDREFSHFVSLALIRPIEEKILPSYLSLILNSRICLHQAAVRSKTNTVTNLHLEEIKNFSIPLPPIDEQKEIAKVLKSAQERIDGEVENKQTLQRLKQGLMQDLLTGEVRTADKAIEVLGEVKAHG